MSDDDLFAAGEVVAEAERGGGEVGAEATPNPREEGVAEAEPMEEEEGYRDSDGNDGGSFGGSSDYRGGSETATPDTDTAEEKVCVWMCCALVSNSKYHMCINNTSIPPPPTPYS